MEELDGTTRTVSSTVPYFFFDLTGRIVPGIFLMLSMRWLGWEPWGLTHFPLNLKDASGIAITSLLFLITAYVIGLLLGTVSYVVEVVWKSIRPLDLDGFIAKRRKDDQHPAMIEEVFEKQFGFPIDKERLKECSDLCHFWVYVHCPSLALIGSRWDAEAMANRSITVAAFIPLFWCLCHSRWDALLVFLAIIGVAFYSYGYVRKRQILSKFDLLISAQR